MPYTPPSSHLTPPGTDSATATASPVPEKKNWASFRKRLFLLPLLYVLGFIPTALFLNLTAWLFRLLTGELPGAVLPWLTGGSSAIFVSWACLRFLIKPLNLDPRQQKKWSWIGTPLVLIGCHLFILAVVFAVCGVMLM